MLCGWWLIIKMILIDLKELVGENSLVVKILSEVRMALSLAVIELGRFRLCS